MSSRKAIGVGWHTTCAALAFSLAGCAVTYQQAQTAFKQARPCCKNLSELKYPMLPGAGQVLVDINDTSQVMAFETGKSYVAAFELPPLARPAALRVKSFALGDHIDRSHIFYPQVLVLDAQHTLLARHPLVGLKATKTSVSEAASENSWGLPVKLEADVPISDPAARFVVIYTSAPLLAASSPYVNLRVSPVILPGIVTTVPLGSYVVQIRHSPFGRLSLTVSAER